MTIYTYENIIKECMCKKIMKSLAVTPHGIFAVIYESTKMKIFSHKQQLFVNKRNSLIQNVTILLPTSFKLELNLLKI